MFYREIFNIKERRKGEETRKQKKKSASVKKKEVEIEMKQN